VLATLVLPACQQRMASQPSGRPDRVSTFFADGRVNRPLVPGTVARGHLRTDLHLYTGGTATGKDAAAVSTAMLGAAALHPQGILAIALATDALRPIDTFPFPITDKVLRHGMHRYLIYCVVCHDPLGTGHGMIVQRGYTPPPSYHVPRLREAPVGHFYQVITLGYGSMPSYHDQIPPRDRWAIAAYIRVLQHSQHFPERELTADMRQAWQKQDNGETP
jgi:mono/diheme cytochrome c family protein